MCALLIALLQHHEHIFHRFGAELLHHLRWRAEANEMTARQERQTHASLGFIHVVRRDQHRSAGVRELVDGLPEGATRGRIDARAGRITHVDGVEVATLADVNKTIAGKPAGEFVTLTLRTLVGEATVRAQLTARRRVRVRAELSESATPEALALRASLTGG